MRGKILEEYKDKLCKVNSNRIIFKKFETPFVGEMISMHQRNTQQHSFAYDVKCPNGKIYVVYPSEIKFEEHKSEPKKQENLQDTYNELINLINETNKKAENLCKTKNKQQLTESLKCILNIRNKYQYLDPIPIVLDSAIELIKNYISKMQ